MKKDSRLERAGVAGYNKPKKTPNHPTKSHVVVAKEKDKIKTIRFGQQGVKGSPKKSGESESNSHLHARYGRRMVDTKYKIMILSADNQEGEKRDEYI